MIQAKFIHPDLQTIPKEHWEKRLPITSSTVVELPLVDRWLDAVMKDTQGRWEVLVEDCSDYHWDAGGMANIKEKTLEWEVDGFKLTCFLRHFEYMLDKLKQSPVSNEYIGDFTCLAGFRLGAAFTVETGQKFMDELMKDAVETIQRADQLWAEFREHIKSRTDRVHIPERRLP